MPPEVLSIGQQYGPLAAIIIFFIYRDWKREEAMNKKISAKDAKLEEISERLIKIITRYDKQSEAVINAINANTRAVKQLILKHDMKADDLFCDDLTPSEQSAAETAVTHKKRD